MDIDNIILNSAMKMRLLLKGNTCRMGKFNDFIDSKFTESETFTNEK